MKSVRAFGPASSGNVIAGFDTLGAALAPISGERWGDQVEITPSDCRALICMGPYARQLPNDPDNLVWRTITSLEALIKAELPPMQIRLTKGLPVGSGVGSSSASIVATVKAANAAFSIGLNEQQQLEAAALAEGSSAGAIHLDNVAPALLGGLQLIHPDGRTSALPFFDELRFVVASPELVLETRAARAVLPSRVRFHTAVDHARRLASLVHALHVGDRVLLRLTLSDEIAEPHRAALVHGFPGVKRAALDAGAWGCSLSGAGPAVLAIAPAGDSSGVGEAMAAAWRHAGIASVVRECVLDHSGARLLEDA